MRLNRKAQPSQPPIELEVLINEWSVRFHGIRIGRVRVEVGGGFTAIPTRGLTVPRYFSTRNEAVAALIEEAKR